MKFYQAIIKTLILIKQIGAIKLIIRGENMQKYINIRGENMQKYTNIRGENIDFCLKIC